MPGAGSILDSNSNLPDDLLRFSVSQRHEPEDIIRQWLECLAKRIGCDWASANIMIDVRRLVKAIVYPYFEINAEKILPVLDEFIPQNECLNRLEQTGFRQSRFWMVEDFLRVGQEYAETALYREVYKDLYCDDQVAIIAYVHPRRTPHSAPAFLLLNFIRSGAVYQYDRTSSERYRIERLLLDLERKLLRQPVVRLMLSQYVQGVLDEHQLVQSSQLGVQTGGLLIGEQAQSKLRKHFPSSIFPDNLPKEAYDWLKGLTHSQKHASSLVLNRNYLTEPLIFNSPYANLRIRAVKTLDRVELRVEEIDDTDALVAKMSKRQKEVLAVLCMGYTHEGIGRLLGIKVKTVEEHVNNLAKLTKVGGEYADRRVRMAVKFSRHSEIAKISNQLAESI